ncbi:site-2 protease family protein [Candidatus Kaiserbacteria bacterium]|nr:site-2 protease family protein [Candidatus Kaiserbacteria bacterium]
MEQIAILIVLILSIVIHEMAHGHVANWLGDPTARLQGRLSPNPLVHIDPLGSVLIPALLFFSQTGIIFGWAKPVPYNPYNLRNQKWGEAIVAIAGPAVNILLAVIFALIIRSSDILNLSQSFTEIATYIVFINILLAMFNMLPIPPLDGSKILLAVLPFRAQMQYRKFMVIMERFGLIGMFLFIYVFITFFSGPFFGFVENLVGLLIGN